MNIYFYKIGFIFIFFLNIYSLISQTLIPQRIIFIKKKEIINNESDYEIILYIENEINKVLEILDSELLIRYSKENEYQNFKNLLNPLTKNNMKKFYFNTNIRGAISFIIENSDNDSDNKIIYLDIYFLNKGTFIRNKFNFTKNNIIEEISLLNDFVKNNIKENFPFINQEVVNKEKFNIIKILREVPNFSLNLKFNVGYMAKNCKIIFRDNDSKSIREMLNGILINFDIYGKIKLFHIGGKVIFVPYIPTNNIFFFDLLFSFETGLYLIQEFFLLKSGIQAGVLNNLDFNNDKKFVGEVFGYIEIGCLPTKYVYLFFLTGVGINIYNIQLNNYFFLGFDLGFGFSFYFKNNFFITLESHFILFIENEVPYYEYENNIEYNIGIENLRSFSTIGFGYRFEKGIKE